MITTDRKHAMMVRCLIFFATLHVGWTAAFGDLIGNVAFNTGPATFRPPVLCVPQSETAPDIDGVLDDAVWENAVATGAFVQLHYPNDRRPPSPATDVKVARDKDTLYLAFICDEPNVAGILDTSKDTRDRWASDVVEIFFDTAPDGPVVWHLATNSRGWQYDSTTTKFHLPEAGREHTPHNPRWRTAATIGDRQWTAEIAVPLAEVGAADVREGQVISFNLARERYNNDGKNELSVWSPTAGIFCKADRYGYLFFGDEAAWANVRSQYIPAETVEVAAYMDRRTYRDDITIAGGGANVGEEDLAGLSLNVSIEQAGKKLRQQTIETIDNNRLYFDVDMSNLAPGDYTFAAEVIKAGETTGRGEHTFTVVVAPEAQTSGRIKLTQSQTVTRGIDRWHARTGVPMPQGALRDVNHVGVFDSRGQQVPAQVQPLAHWSKAGSIKWLSVDFQTPLVADEQATYELRYGPGIEPMSELDLTVEETDTTITVRDIFGDYLIHKQGFGGVQRSDDADGLRGPYVVGENGDVFWASNDANSNVTIEERGPRMIVVKASGAHVNAAGETLCRYVTHLYFYAETPYVRIQHTFIISEDSTQTRYADIGFAFPVAGDQATFGLPAGRYNAKVGGSVSLLQRTWENFVVKDNAGNRVILEADRAPGWIARGGTALIVRDFWQNFPKELEATPSDLRVHFWPRHGETVFTQAQEMDPDYAWRLPFAHHGKLLDFNIPDYYFQSDALKVARFDRNDTARACNAIGVGKTHDMLLAFGSADQTAALNEAFQAGVHFMPDPQWVCDSLAAGELHAYDPDRFAQQEDYFSRGHDFLMRAMFDANQAYGMFNYGDGFTMLDTASPELNRSYYRLWAGYHHGRARVPWLLYLRSGDPKYLTWARANTGHIADVDTCHYTNEKFSNESGLARKLVGGLCTYNAVVHWENGSFFNYNSMADIFLYDYYLTGNRRAWDVFEEVASLARAEGDTRCPPNRAGAGILSTLLQCYEATWDPQFIVTFLSQIPNMYSKPAWEHQPRSVTWAPYLEPYIRLSDDPAAKAFLLQHADYLADLDAVGARVQYHHRELAEASRITGHPRYRLAAWSHLVRSPGLYESETNNFDGEVYWLDYSFLTQHALYLMRPMAEAGALPALADLPAVPGSGGPTTWVHSLREPGEKQTLTLTVDERADQPFTFGTRFGSYADVDYTLTSPNGQTIDTGSIARPTQDQFKFELNQPTDGETGTYRLDLSSPRRFFFWYASLSDLGTHRFHLPDPSAPRGRLDEPPGLGGNHTGCWYFYVPPECEQFRIRAMGWADARARTVAAVVDPTNRIVDRLSLLPREQGDLVIEPKRAHRGKVWALSFDQAVVVDVEGIDRWFAGTLQGALPSR